jgi:hypothetical protein
LSSPRLSTIAKIKQNQATSSQFRTRFSPFAIHEIKQKSSKVKQCLNKVLSSLHPSHQTKSSNTIAKKAAQIKQSEAKFEPGFDLHPRITPDKINFNKATQ